MVASADYELNEFKRVYEKSHSPLLIPVKLRINGTCAVYVESHKLLTGCPAMPPRHGLSINLTLIV